MAIATALNGRNYFGESASGSRSTEEKALDFFCRADLSESQEATGARDFSLELARRPESNEHKAMDFFWRAELGETLEHIWTVIKRQQLGTVLKLIKAVAIVRRSFS